MVSAFSVPKAQRSTLYSIQHKSTQITRALANTSIVSPLCSPENSPKVIKKSDPLYSFGKEARNEQISKVPGPGSYEPKEHFVADVLLEWF